MTRHITIPKVGERWESKGAHGPKRREVVSVIYTAGGRVRVAWMDWMNPSKASECLETSWLEFTREAYKIREGNDVVPCCNTCHFWWDDRDGEIGVCRARPPQRVDQDVTAWPQTGKNDWCGSWSFREDQ